MFIQASAQEGVQKKNTKEGTDSHICPLGHCLASRGSAVTRGTGHSIRTSHFVRFLAHLSQRLIGELIVYQSSPRLSVSLSTLSNMNISTTSRRNSTKVYLKHHLGGGLISLSFGIGRIGTPVSMATDSSHRVIMEKILWPL